MRGCCCRCCAPRSGPVPARCCPACCARRWWVLTVPLLWVVMEALRERSRGAGSRGDGWRSARPTRCWSDGRPSAARRWSRSRWPWRPRRCWRRGTPCAAGGRGQACSPWPSIGALVVGGALARGAGWGGPDGPAEQMAIVQGNVPRLGLDFNAQRRAVLDNHVRATQELALEVAAGDAGAAGGGHLAGELLGHRPAAQRRRRPADRCRRRCDRRADPRGRSRDQPGGPTPR